MPITLGILAQSRQAAVASDFVLLETQVLGSAASSITFSGLSSYSSTYKHLQVRMAFDSSAESSIKFQFNGDTTGNYSLHALQGNGSATASFGQTNQGAGYAGYVFTNTYSGVLDILDAFNTSKFKTTRCLTGTTGSTGHRIFLTSSLWRNTNALTSLLVYNESGNFSINARFSLYGVR